MQVSSLHACIAVEADRLEGCVAAGWGIVRTQANAARDEEIAGLPFGRRGFLKSLSRTALVLTLEDVLSLARPLRGQVVALRREGAELARAAEAAQERAKADALDKTQPSAQPVKDAPGGAQ